MSDMFGRVVRSPQKRNVGLSKPMEVLNLFAIEYNAFRSEEESTAFFVANIRATNLVEARHILKLYLVKQKHAITATIREYDFGKDRSWLRGNKDYQIKVLDVKQYDRAIYERNREAQLESL